MAIDSRKSYLLLTFLSVIYLAEGMEYCDGNYWCEEGHCCGQGRCCTYYYEVWWFWLIWCMIALIVGCCFYQQKRLRLRRQLRYRAEVEAEAAGRNELIIPSQPGVESPAIIQHAATSTGVQLLGPVFDPDKTLRLPSYDEVEQLPKDPPAYNLLYNGTGAQGPSSASVTVPPDEPPPFDAGAHPALVEYNSPVPFTDNPVHVWAGLPAYVHQFGNVMPSTASPGASQTAMTTRDIHISNAGTIEGPSLISPPEYSMVTPSSGCSERHPAGSATPPGYSLADRGAAAPAVQSDGSENVQNRHNTSLQDVDDSLNAGLLDNEVKPSSQHRH